MFTVPFAGRNGTQYMAELWKEDYDGEPTVLKAATNTFTIDCGNGDIRFDFYRPSTGYLNIIIEDSRVNDLLIPFNHTDILVKLHEVGKSDVIWQGYVNAEGYEMPLQPVPYIMSLPLKSILSVLDDIPYVPYKFSSYVAVCFEQIFSINNLPVNFLGVPKGFTFREQFDDLCYNKNRELNVTVKNSVVMCSNVLEDIAKFYNCQVCEKGDTIYLINSHYDIDIYNNVRLIGNPIRTERIISHTGNSLSSSFVQKWMPSIRNVELTGSVESLPIYVHEGKMEMPTPLLKADFNFHPWHFISGFNISFLLEKWTGTEYVEVKSDDAVSIVVTVSGVAVGMGTILYQGNKSYYLTYHPVSNPQSLDLFLSLRSTKIINLRISDIKLSGVIPEQVKNNETIFKKSTGNFVGDDYSIECGIVRSPYALNSIVHISQYNEPEYAGKYEELIDDMCNWFKNTQRYISFDSELDEIPLPNKAIDVNHLSLPSNNVITAYSIDFWQSSANISIQATNTTFSHTYSLTNYSNTNKFFTVYNGNILSQMAVLIDNDRTVENVAEMEALGLHMSGDNLVIIGGKTYISKQNCQFDTEGRITLMLGDKVADEFIYNIYLTTPQIVDKDGKRGIIINKAPGTYYDVQLFCKMGEFVYEDFHYVAATFKFFLDSAVDIYRQDGTAFMAGYVPEDTLTHTYIVDMLDENDNVIPGASFELFIDPLLD